MGLSVVSTVSKTDAHGIYNNVGEMLIKSEHTHTLYVELLSVMSEFSDRQDDKRWENGESRSFSLGCVVAFIFLINLMLPSSLWYRNYHPYFADEDVTWENERG